MNLSKQEKLMVIDHPASDPNIMSPKEFVQLLMDGETDFTKPGYGECHIEGSELVIPPLDLSSLDLGKLVFDCPVEFAQVTIKNVMNFGEATFKARVKLSNSQFLGDCYFGAAEFIILDCQQASFHSSVDLGKAIINTLDCGRAKFYGDFLCNQANVSLLYIDKAQFEGLVFAHFAPYLAWQIQQYKQGIIYTTEQAEAWVKNNLSHRHSIVFV